MGPKQHGAAMVSLWRAHDVPMIVQCTMVCPWYLHGVSKAPWCLACPRWVRYTMVSPWRPRRVSITCPWCRHGGSNAPWCVHGVPVVVQCVVVGPWHAHGATMVGSKHYDVAMVSAWRTRSASMVRPELHVVSMAPSWCLHGVPMTPSWWVRSTMVWP